MIFTKVISGCDFNASASVSVDRVSFLFFFMTYLDFTKNYKNRMFFDVTQNIKLETEINVCSVCKIRSLS